ncbi:MAG: hypothetical protein U0T36_08225 [Saprospiraceae bacterium]
MEKKNIGKQVVAQQQTPLIMDLNNDCIPEIITAGFNNFSNNWLASSEIIAFDNNAQNTLYTISTYYFFTYTNSFVFIKHNNEFEIILAVADININPFNVRGKLVCYNSDNTIKWISDQKYSGQIGQSGSLSLADFNRDGISEIFIHNNIFNTETGILLASGGNNGMGGTGLSTVSIAANLDDDPNDLELAAGYTVYKIKLNNLNGVVGNTIIPNNVLINGLGRDGLTTVSDINSDQKLDIIVITAQSFYSGIYIYTYQNSTYEIIAKIDWPTYLQFGVLSIGNLTQIGKLDILLTTNNAIKKYSYDNSILLKEDWSLTVNDGSGFSGLSMFDFDNDSIHEIIYRDEVELKIINAKNDNPKIIFKTNCVSQTHFEYPLIADIDGTGETKICVTCSENFSDQNGKLTIFGPPPGQHWAPARNIWHQYAYNPLFINDDGTVPQYMHNPATYKNGKYNNFMVQESLIDEDGNYPVAAASLTGQVTCIDYDVATQQYTATFSIHNRSDASAQALSGLPISFYNGNPESGGSRIGVYHTSADIIAGATISPLTYTFSAVDLTKLYMVVNTDKSPIILSDTSYYGIDECDYTDNVFIAPAPKIISTTQEICQGDSYAFYGNVLTAAGQYTHEISNAQACDSIVAILDLRVTTTKTAQQNIATCEHYDWNGNTYTQSGQYTYHTTSSNGCDSIVTLDLTIHAKQNTSLTQSACDTFTLQGTTYDQSGQYTFQAQTIHGCDSIITLDLSIHPTYDISSTVAACETYTWQGTTYDQSGKYTFSTKTSAGCDSVMILDLTISKVLQTSQKQAVCDRYVWNGSTYTQSGQYTYKTTSTNGCDSIVTLDLTIHPRQSTSLSQKACGTYTYQGKTYDQSGQYTFQAQTIHGCDSIITLDLTIHPSYDVRSTVAACDTYTWQGTTYDQSGVYTFAAKTAAGCDSVMILDLTVSDILHTSTNRETCDRYTWNGSTYTQSGQYTYKTTSTNGCDSIVTLDLTIHAKQSTALTQSACDTYTYQGKTYDRSGQYTFKAQTIRSSPSNSLHSISPSIQHDIRSAVCGL